QFYTRFGGARTTGTSNCSLSAKPRNVCLLALLFSSLTVGLERDDAQPHRRSSGPAATVASRYPPRPASPRAARRTSAHGAKRAIRHVRFMSAHGGRSGLDMLSLNSSESDPERTVGRVWPTLIGHCARSDQTQHTMTIPARGERL